MALAGSTLWAAMRSTQPLVIKTSNLCRVIQVVSCQELLHFCQQAPKGRTEGVHLLQRRRIARRNANLVDKGLPAAQPRGGRSGSWQRSVGAWLAGASAPAAAAAAQPSTHQDFLATRPSTAPTSPHQQQRTPAGHQLQCQRECARHDPAMVALQGGIVSLAGCLAEGGVWVGLQAVQQGHNKLHGPAGMGSARQVRCVVAR